MAELQTNPAGQRADPHDAAEASEIDAAVTSAGPAAPRNEPTESDLDRAVMQPGPAQVKHAAALTFIDRVEAFIARLSTKNHFWHRVCSLIWLPYAFKSGIRMKKVDETTFTAVLPFKRFNRNWYNAMAGASLLANSEIAGGMYIFGITGGKYTLVCKKLEYEFLRPCFGPAVYRISPREDLHALIATGKEFNITLDLVVMQQPLVPETVAKLKKKDSLLARMAAKERRVGISTATFHLTPALHQKAKRGHVRKVG